MNAHPITRARLVPDHIDELVPYKPGKTVEEVQRSRGLARVHKLASNENPLGPSPRALTAMRDALERLHMYPDSTGMKLRQALAEHYRMKPENVVLGGGSEGIMATIVRTFLHGDDEVLTSEGTFIGFMVLAKAHGTVVKTVPLKSFAYDLDALAAAVTPRTKLVYLANPNNPTGTIFTRASFERFLDRLPPHVLVLLDEAYYEYVGERRYEYPDSQLYRADNVLTLRTFSKAYGLAGIRIGYGLGHENLIAPLQKVKLPFEAATLGLEGAIAALADEDFLRETIANNQLGLKRLESGLATLGATFVPSEANFVMIDLGTEAEVDRITESLLDEGIVVRPLRGFGLPQCLRVSVGLPEQVDIFLEAFGRIWRPS
ncbi:MAG: histidinol-phosphate transaminase [bacterium]|nr:histidinol-phosphate transaminase [bacterium]